MRVVYLLVAVILACVVVLACYGLGLHPFACGLVGMATYAGLYHLVDRHTP